MILGQIDAASIIAIIFGCVTVVTIAVGSAWKVSGAMGSLTSEVKTNNSKTDETLQLVREHAKDCDQQRAEFDVKHKATSHTLTDHSERLRGLETGT